MIVFLGGVGHLWSELGIYDGDTRRTDLRFLAKVSKDLERDCNGIQSRRKVSKDLAEKGRFGK